MGYVQAHDLIWNDGECACSVLGSWAVTRWKMGVAGITQEGFHAFLFYCPNLAVWISTSTLCYLVSPRRCTVYKGFMEQQAGITKMHSLSKTYHSNPPLLIPPRRNFINKPPLAFTVRTRAQNPSEKTPSLPAVPHYPPQNLQRACTHSHYVCALNAIQLANTIRSFSVQR